MHLRQDETQTLCRGAFACAYPTPDPTGRGSLNRVSSDRVSGGSHCCSPIVLESCTRGGERFFFLRIHA